MIEISPVERPCRRRAGAGTRNHGGICLARPGQTLSAHLRECEATASRRAERIGLPTIGRIVGLLHDIGKYSVAFQNYIRGESASGGDHSSAGGLFVLRNFRPDPARVSSYYLNLCFRQIIALCCFSHHAGTLLDCAPPPAARRSIFTRIESGKENSALLDEISARVPAAFQEKIARIFSSEKLQGEIRNFHERMNAFVGRKIPADKQFKENRHAERLFVLGSTARFLLSCLVDADHASAAGDKPQSGVPAWEKIERNLDEYLSRFPKDTRVDELRAEISERCRAAGTRPRGLAVLTLPTGSGKTLASFRYAVSHAKKHGLERIIYVIPYTSILTQNVKIIREAAGTPFAAQILEHHSDIVPESDDENYKKQTEAWDAPIIFTTTVQFLNALYAKGAANVRRMNKLSRAAIVFDEVQALPTSSIYLFNKALNFLVEFCGASVLLCTATQPLLDRVPEKFHALDLPENPHVIEDSSRYFSEFEKHRKVKIRDLHESGSWNLDDFSEFLLKQAKSVGHTLAIVNTKKFAADLFSRVRECADDDVEVFHLSTSMCSAHRSRVIDECISRNALADATRRGKRVLCVSTQVIECGVDADFDVVVRSVAGADSMIQAFGRCNRDGRLASGGNAFIIRPTKTYENTSAIKQIEIGKERSLQVLRENGGNARLGRDALARYFSLYFEKLADVLKYPLPHNLDACELLTLNREAFSVFADQHPLEKEEFPLPQAFETVASAYSPIEENTVPVIVPYKPLRERDASATAETEPPDEEKNGEEIIAALQDLREPHTEEEWRRVRKLLRIAQRFSVAVGRDKLRGETGSRLFLKNEGAVEFYSLNPGFYRSGVSSVGLDPTCAGTPLIL